VPDPNRFEFEIVIENLKRYKSPRSDEIPAYLIQAGGEMLRCKIHKLIISIWKKEKCLINGRILSLYQFTRRVIKTDCSIIVGIQCYQLHTKCYPIFFNQAEVHI
jgi:hypothetical protein